MVTTVRFLSICHMTQKSFPSVSGTDELWKWVQVAGARLLCCPEVTFPLFLFFICLHLYPSLSLFSVCLYPHPNFLFVSIFILVFCLSPSIFLFSVCLNLCPHFLSVSFLSPFLVCLYLFLIFCLSPTFSSFFICLHLYPSFLSVSISIFILCLHPYMETNKKWGLRDRWRQMDEKYRDRDRQIIGIKMETDRKWG